MRLLTKRLAEERGVSMSLARQLVAMGWVTVEGMTVSEVDAKVPDDMWVSVQRKEI